MYHFEPTAVISCDTETTGLKVHAGDRPFAVSLANEHHQTWYCEWSVDPFTRRVYPVKKDVRFLRGILGNSEIETVFHNAPFDIPMLGSVGIDVNGPIHETTIEARTVNTLEISLKLKDLALKYCQIPKDDEKALEDIVKRLRNIVKKQGWKLADNYHADYWVPRVYDGSTQCSEYAILDALRTIKLHQFCTPRIQRDKYRKITYAREINTLPATMRMINRGMACDRDECVQSLTHYTASAKQHEARAIEICNKNFGFEDININSGQQLAAVLFSAKGYNLPIQKWTKGGKTGKKMPATDWKALREYSDNQLVREVNEAKNATKAASTFFSAYLREMVPDVIVPGVNVLHPGLNQAGALTGRYSCAILHQTPRDESNHGKAPIHARKPFGPRPGYRWYCVDYAQQELRLFADIGNIGSMMDAALAGRDLNNENADKAWGGRNNPAAVEAASNALELGMDAPSNDEIAAAWLAHGWNARLARVEGPRSRAAQAVADEWLARFDYSIIDAEKSVGSKYSRVRAKNVMFAKIYGGGVEAVKDFLFCSDRDAAKFLREIERAFPEMVPFMKRTENTSRLAGFIVNPYGRKIDVDPRAAYRAVNYVIQSTAADIMKTAIVKCDDFLRDTGLDAHLLMTIHDELIFEVKNEHSYLWLLRKLKELMEDTEGRLRVPMTVEFSRVRTRWNKKELLEI